VGVQLTNVEAEIADVFSDMADLVSQCRFNDSEPDCAIQNAIELGEINTSRFARWSKLVLEECSNSSSMAARSTDNRSQLKRTKKIKQ
jgi:ribosome biogenesis GTPase / thiamine phosphate phosphatase